MTHLLKGSFPSEARLRSTCRFRLRPCFHFRLSRHDRPYDLATSRPKTASRRATKGRSKKADVLLVWKHNLFSQDVLFRERPIVGPGMKPASTRIEIITEFASAALRWHFFHVIGLEPCFHVN